MPIFIPPMLISLRSRKPLIMVVLCLSCPAIFVLIVILKSPRIGWSVSGLRCANEIALTAEMAKMIAVHRNNLLFMKMLLRDPDSNDGKNVSNLSKSEALLNRQMGAVARLRGPQTGSPAGVGR